MKFILVLLLVFVCVRSQLINYTPYSDDCSSIVSGVGFGLLSMTCLQNTTTGSIFSFNLYESTYVNISSSHWGYCDDPVATQIFKLDSCGYYPYSKTNYYVYESDQPQIPSNSYIIEQYDSTCENRQNYWYAPNGTVVVDFKQNLSTTYLCVSTQPFTNVCTDAMDRMYLNIIVFLFLTTIIKAQNDLSCIDRFVKGIGQVSLFSTNPSPTINEYCFKGNLIKCNNGFVTDINIDSANSSFILDSNYLNCFSKLVNFQLSNFILDDKIFYSPITSQSLDTFIVINPNISSFSLSQQIKLNMSNFKIIFIDTTIVSPINLSYLQIVKNSITIDQENSKIKFINDKSQIKLPPLYISVSDIPDLTNVEIDTLQLTVGTSSKGFNASSVENFKTFENVKNLVYESGYNAYPYEIQSISNNKMESLEMKLSINNALDRLFDFSNFSSLIKLRFSNSLNLFYNSNIPIGVYPPNLNEFSFDGNSLANFPNLDLIKSPFVDLNKNSFQSLTNPFKSSVIKKLDLSNNLNIANTIDDSYCQTIVILNNNSMSGVLPECIKCHLSDTTIAGWYSGNKYDLTPSIGCSSIIPKMKISNGNTYLYGSNLGFLSSAIISIPSINFIIDTPSISFYSPHYTTSTLFNISITSSGSNRQFTVSNDPYYPTPKTITFKTTLQVEFNGVYFTYDKSITNITIDSIQCNPVEVDFYRILCNLSSIVQHSSNIPVTLVIGNLSSSLILKSSNVGIPNPIENCKDSCNRAGSCNFETLKCQCDQNHLGDNCEIKAIPCVDPTCGGIGVCDKTIGQCDCGLINTGNSCELPAHWVSSIEPPGESGGVVLLSGYFSNQHVNLSVIIGGKPCNISLSSPPTISNITCSIGPGTGIKNITVIQNTVSWSSNSMFQYYNGNFRCPNDCSNHGTCNSNTGICTCTGEWASFDCSSKSNQQSNTTIDNGSATINNQDTTYSISIYKLIEVDYNGKVIKEFNFTNNLTWDKTVVNSTTGNSKIIKYNKHIQTNDSSSVNVSTNITTTFEEVGQSGERSFAGVNFQLEKGSVKLSISITNYPFKNYLNTLQLVLKSNTASNKNGCGDDNDTNLEKNQSENSQLDYISIKKGDKVLKGRFINRIISDNKSTFITSSINQSETSSDEIFVTLNLPHCIKECLLDPDFSVLVDPNFSSSCGTSRKWVIPVAVVVSVVGAFALVILVVVLYKKNRIYIQIRLKTIRDK
ncbi:hypothetical protein RB653_008796 [Dictyostelium firmibasis]|uniref:EGF-like domain-containing protein n=1 Tax=Dictyostelium firmibasis TaxID=79012 RepID=A0AAN7TZT5_9MYCE